MTLQRLSALVKLSRHARIHGEMRQGFLFLSTSRFDASMVANGHDAGLVSRDDKIMSSAMQATGS